MGRRGTGAGCPFVDKSQYIRWKKEAGAGPHASCVPDTGFFFFFFEG